MLEIGPCDSSYQMGFHIGQKFSNQIRSRIASDLILRNHLLPFAHSHSSRSLIGALSDSNRKKFPAYWNELQGTADGSGVPMLQLLLLNFRKEILPFVPKTADAKLSDAAIDSIDDCSDVLVVNDSMAVAAHNEDANVALIDHTYLIKSTLPSGLSFTAYTYAGELPSCAFGFNSHGLAFTLNSVPPNESEIDPSGIGRNFISRNLLEATSLEDAIDRIRSCTASVGHSYNLIDARTRRIINLETSSRNRMSIREVGEEPFFHANMYLHLKEVHQANDESSWRRQKRAAELSKHSKQDFLNLLGDSKDSDYPIYMSGPLLHTLCTAVIDLDERTLSIIEGNPKNSISPVSYVFSLSS